MEEFDLNSQLSLHPSESSIMTCMKI